MRIAFVVNHLATERPRGTTVVLAHAAHRLGYQVFLMDVGDLACYADGRVGGPARAAPGGMYADSEAFLEAVRDRRPNPARIDTSALDVLWLRYNPSECGLEEKWAAITGIRFGQLAARQGTLVLDDPEGLLYAEGKLYLQQFPESVRPRTLVTRSMDEIRSFHSGTGRTVLKPLDGYGGEDVFLIEGPATNLGALVQSLSRRGFIVAQEFLSAAVEGDIRLFLMNGAPLRVQGKFAAIRRVNRTGDFRSNMLAGGVAEQAHLDETVLRLAAEVGPRLKEDGIFLAGIDIVGNRVVEINTMSPGGLHSAIKLEGVDFASEVIRAVARKLDRRRETRASLSNRVLASME